MQIAGMCRFHPECFVCHCCKVCISDGDLYALVLRSKAAKEPATPVVFCADCYQVRIESQLQSLWWMFYSVVLVLFVGVMIK